MSQTYEWLDSNIATQVYKFKDKKYQTYPPHNITHKVIATSDEYSISFAVAGLKHNELFVEQDEDILTISGGDINTVCWHSSFDVDPRVVDILHSGISTRPFNISFMLGIGVEVNKVTLLDGILTVNLVKTRPDAAPKRVFNIEVRDATLAQVSGNLPPTMKYIGPNT